MPRTPADFLGPFLKPLSESLSQGVQLAENVRRFQAGQPLRQAQTKLAQAKVRQQESAEKLFKQLTGTETLFDSPVGGADLFKDPVARAIINQATGLSIGKPEPTSKEKIAFAVEKDTAIRAGRPTPATEREKIAFAVEKEKALREGRPTPEEKTQQAVQQFQALTPSVVARTEATEPSRTRVAEARGRAATREAVARTTALAQRPPTAPEIDEAAANMLYQAAQFTENFAKDLDPTFETVINKLGKKYGLKLFRLFVDRQFPIPNQESYKALPEIPQLPAPNQVSNRDELIQWVSQTYALEPWEALEYLKELANAGTISFK